MTTTSVFTLASFDSGSEGKADVAADAIYCRNCRVLVSINAILDSMAAGRPDDECPRCLAPALAYNQDVA